MDLSEFEKGWMAGILDGEGYVGAYPANSGRSIAFRIAIESTSGNIIEKFAEILRKMGIQCRIQGLRRREENRAPIQAALISRMLDCHRFALAFENLCVLKGPQLRMLREYLETATIGSPDIAKATTLIQDLKDAKRLLGGTLLEEETIPSQAGEGEQLWLFGSPEGVTATQVSPNDNPAQERPAPKIDWEAQFCPPHELFRAVLGNGRSKGEDIA